MLKYLGKRVLFGCLSIFLLVTIAFFLTRSMPGSPFQTSNVSDEVLEKMEEQYGLREPILIQYQTYLKNLLKGDMGISYQKPGLRVTDVIQNAFWPTVIVGGLATMTALIFGTGLGIWQACSERSWVRHVLLLFTMFGTGIPNFVIASVSALVFGVLFKMLPISGLTGWQSYILPVLSLSIYPMAVVTRMTESSFSKEMKKEYVRLAKAKELPEWKILFVHVLKNAWIPVLNYMGPTAAFLLTGSFVVESIFNIPGLGREFVNSIGNRDYTMILGLTTFMGIVVVVINILVDLLCAWLDPKIRLAYGKDAKYDTSI